MPPSAAGVAAIGRGEAIEARADRGLLHQQLDLGVAAKMHGGR
jgi:hypothetical protein